jgi:hypothetical protein
MNKQTIKQLIKHLKTESDFLSIFKESIYRHIEYIFAPVYGE